MVSAEPIEGTSHKIIHKLKNERGTSHINVGETERLISIAVGIPMTIFGLNREILNRPLPILLGRSLILRGVTGRSFLYQTRGVSTVEHSPATIAELPDNQGIQVKRAVTINASPEELYRYWRDFKNAPRFMVNVESVQVTGDGRSHWVAKTPMNKTVEWDAEVTQDEPGQLIAWRRTQGPFLAPNGGAVHFPPKRHGRGAAGGAGIEIFPFPRRIDTILCDVFRGISAATSSWAR